MNHAFTPEPESFRGVSQQQPNGSRVCDALLRPVAFALTFWVAAGPTSGSSAGPTSRLPSSPLVDLLLLLPEESLSLDEPDTEAVDDEDDGLE